MLTALPKQSRMIDALQQVAMGGRATFMGWNGYGNVLNLIFEQKQLVNFKFFFAMSRQSHQYQLHCTLHES